MKTKFVQLAPGAAGDTACGVSFSTHPQYVALRLLNGAPQIYDFAAEKYMETPLCAPASGIAFRPHRPGDSPSHEVAVVGPREKRLIRFDVRTGEHLYPITLNELARCLAYSHWGDSIATGDGDGVVRVYQLGEHDYNVVLEAKVADAGIVDIAFGPKGVYGVTANGATFAWDMLSDSPDVSKTPCLRAADGGRFDWDCYVLASDSDRKFVAFAGEGNNVLLLAPATGHIETLDTNLGGFVRAAQFDPAGWRLTVAGKHTVEVWNLGPFQPVECQSWPDAKVLGARSFDDLLVAVGIEK